MKKWGKTVFWLRKSGTLGISKIKTYAPRVNFEVALTYFHHIIV